MSDNGYPIDALSSEIQRRTTDVSYGYLSTWACDLPFYERELRSFLQSCSNVPRKGSNDPLRRARAIHAAVKWGIAHPVEWDAMLIPSKIEKSHATKRRRSQ